MTACQGQELDHGRAARSQRMREIKTRIAFGRNGLPLKRRRALSDSALPRSAICTHHRVSGRPMAACTSEMALQEY